MCKPKVEGSLGFEKISLRNRAPFNDMALEVSKGK